MRNAAQYVRIERRIAAADTGANVERWRFGGRLRADSSAWRGKILAPGVLEQLVAAAQAAGLALSVREIQWRLRCALTYQTEDELRNALRSYGSWHELTQAGFPPVDHDPDAEPADHRSPEQKKHDRASLLADIARAGIGQQMLPFPPDWDPDTRTLADLEKYAAEMDELAANMNAVNARRHVVLDAYLAATDGNRGATWREAHRAAFGRDDDL